MRIIISEINLENDIRDVKIELIDKLMMRRLSIGELTEIVNEIDEGAYLNTVDMLSSPEEIEFTILDNKILNIYVEDVSIIEQFGVVFNYKDTMVRPKRITIK